MSLKQGSQLPFLRRIWDILHKQRVVIPLAHGSWRLLKHIKVDYTLLFEPLLCLIDYNSLTLGHLNSHRLACSAASITIKEFSLGLVQLLRHWCGHCVLIHEEIVPIGLIVEVSLEDLLFLTLVVWLFGSRWLILSWRLRLVVCSLVLLCRLIDWRL